MAKGNFIEYVVSDNPNKYPDGEEQGGYYYEKCLTSRWLLWLVALMNKLFVLQFLPSQLVGQYFEVVE